MRKLPVLLVIVAICGLASTVLAEDLPPVSLGSGQTSTQNANGQQIEVSVSGAIQVTVYFENVQQTVVSGLVVRTSGGSTSGSVTIRWINQNRQETYQLSSGNPNQQFSLEGGDGDKRTDKNDLH
jgi:biopolymer transport protein ExbD